MIRRERGALDSSCHAGAWPTGIGERMAQAGKAAKPNVFARVRSYFKHVSTELKRVVWPGRTEVINSSFVVVVTLLFFVAFTFIVDSLSSWLFIDLLAGIGR